MAQPEQRMSRLLLSAMVRSTAKAPTEDLRPEYGELLDIVEDEDYTVCLAWAIEQHELVIESKGAHLPLMETIE